MKQDHTQNISRLADFLRAHKRITVFTGAGISTESGISDYRSKGGIWDRFQPVTFQEFVSDEDKRRLYWARKKELLRQMKSARPNDAHRAVGRLAEAGKLHGLITQNIDGLHQEAGVHSADVVEIHGTMRESVCLSCGAKTGWEHTLARLDSGEDTLRCKEKNCNGLIKPNTISFGQMLSPDTLSKATELARSSDAMLVIGSTLIVEPAASFPRMAQAGGAALAIVNLSETPMDAHADLAIHEKAGEIVPPAVQSILM